MNWKIGNVQWRFLRACQEFKGYAAGGGWVWAGRAKSVRLAEQLVARGLLEKTTEPFLGSTRTRYTVTEAGRAYLERGEP